MDFQKFAFFSSCPCTFYSSNSSKLAVDTLSFVSQLPRAESPERRFFTVVVITKHANGQKRVPDETDFLEDFVDGRSSVQVSPPSLGKRENSLPRNGYNITTKGERITEIMCIIYIYILVWEQRQISTIIICRA